MKLHKLTKISIPQNAQCPSAKTKEEYRLNMDEFSWGEISRYEGLSPNIDYWVVGEIDFDPVVGKAVWMDRINRNGKATMGRFNTSTIEKIEPQENGIIILTTLNSVYKMELLSEEDAKHFLREKEIADERLRKYLENEGEL